MAKFYDNRQDAERVAKERGRDVYVTEDGKFFVASREKLSKLGYMSLAEQDSANGVAKTPDEAYAIKQRARENDDWILSNFFPHGKDTPTQMAKSISTNLIPTLSTIGASAISGTNPLAGLAVGAVSPQLMYKYRKRTANEYEDPSYVDPLIQSIIGGAAGVATGYLTGTRKEIDEAKTKYADESNRIDESHNNQLARIDQKLADHKINLAKMRANGARQSSDALIRALSGGNVIPKSNQNEINRRKLQAIDLQGKISGLDNKIQQANDEYDESVKEYERLKDVGNKNADNKLYKQDVDNRTTLSELTNSLNKKQNDLRLKHINNYNNAEIKRLQDLAVAQLQPTYQDTFDEVKYNKEKERLTKERENLRKFDEQTYNDYLREAIDDQISLNESARGNKYYSRIPELADEVLKNPTLTRKNAVISPVVSFNPNSDSQLKAPELPHNFIPKNALKPVLDETGKPVGMSLSSKPEYVYQAMENFNEQLPENIDRRFDSKSTDDFNKMKHLMQYYHGEDFNSPTRPTENAIFTGKPLPLKTYNNLKYGGANDPLSEFAVEWFDKYGNYEDEADAKDYRARKDESSRRGKLLPSAYDKTIIADFEGNEGLNEANPGSRLVSKKQFDRLSDIAREVATSDLPSDVVHTIDSLARHNATKRTEIPVSEEAKLLAKQKAYEDYNARMSEIPLEEHPALENLMYQEELNNLSNEYDDKIRTETDKYNMMRTLNDGEPTLRNPPNRKLTDDLINKYQLEKSVLQDKLKEINNQMSQLTANEATLKEQASKPTPEETKAKNEQLQTNSKNNLSNFANEVQTTDALLDKHYADVKKTIEENRKKAHSNSEKTKNKVIRGVRHPVKAGLIGTASGLASGLIPFGLDVIDEHFGDHARRRANATPVEE